jgi:hypothetical protein
MNMGKASPLVCTRDPLILKDSPFLKLVGELD